jgi:hypothetical protein
MDQSGKDSASKAAWITGGFALVGTVLTLIFAGPKMVGDGGNPSGSPQAPPSSSAVVPVPPVPPSQSPTSLLPDGLEGSWIGGVGKDSSRHLMLTKEAGYVLWDTAREGAPIYKGKAAFNGSTATFFGEDKSIQSFSWYLEKSPVGDILHLSEQSYRRE